MLNLCSIVPLCPAKRSRRNFYFLVPEPEAWAAAAFSSFNFCFSLIRSASLKLNTKNTLCLTQFFITRNWIKTSACEPPMTFLYFHLFQQLLCFSAGLEPFWPPSLWPNHAGFRLCVLKEHYYKLSRRFSYSLTQISLEFWINSL